MDKTVGILGGMGPEATSVFFDRIVRLTPARRDQDHLKILVVNDPKTPDRTAYLKGKGESPLPSLLNSARLLEKMGADFISIPCNTAHHFWAEIAEAVQLPVLNIVHETVMSIARDSGAESTGRPIGIMATQGTLASGLYQRSLESNGLIPVVPSPGFQRKIALAIARIKGEGERSEAVDLLKEVVEHLEGRGSSAVIYGCTELGLTPFQPDMPVFDSLEILARATVSLALGNVKYSLP